MSNAPPLPRWADLVLLPLINLCVSFFICGVIIFLIGENPFDALVVMMKGAFYSSDGISRTLYYTTNFIFTGLSVATAFHALMFNIGGEGQAYLGGLGAALAALFLGPYLPAVIIIPICVLSAACFGALWAFIPGYLQAKRGSHIVITTIMFNFIAAALMTWLLAGPMMQAGQQSPQSEVLPSNTLLPSMKTVFNFFGLNLPETPFNLSFVIALGCLVFFWVLIWRTRLGYEMRAVGKSQEAARYAGINVSRIIIITLLISGGFSGLMATNEVMGASHRIVLNFTAGFGFTGIAVALMGRNHPVGIFLASLLFGAIYQGGTELDFEFQLINRDMVLVMQGMIILFSGGLAYMFKPMLARFLGGKINA